MASAGEKEGMSHEKALQIAAQTFMGAAKLILKGGDPETLLQQITVPQGTTAAGLKMMTALQIDDHFRFVVQSASQRSKEISEEFCH
jgi:pyrroline-5-carboxylate reductase